MPLNIHYILKSKVNSNDKVVNSIEKGAFPHILKRFVPRYVSV